MHAGRPDRVYAKRDTAGATPKWWIANLMSAEVGGSLATRSQPRLSRANDAPAAGRLSTTLTRPCAKDQRKPLRLLTNSHLPESTTVVGTPIADASRASVSSDGVCRPASTRAMFGR